MKVIMASVASLLVTGSAYATGSVECVGKVSDVPATVSWGTSHSEGSQMISPISVKIGKEKGKEREITVCESKSTFKGCDKATGSGPVVGYWVSPERVLINITDDELKGSIFKMETWWSKKRKQFTGTVTLKAPLVDKETRIPVRCDQA